MRLLFLCFLLIFSTFSFSQNAYRFRNYTISDGLSQSAISTLIQDNIGSLWIGTQDGLNRYDGQTFETFTPDNSEGIENGDVLSAIKSKSGMLWFGTSNGLTQYDPNTENFKTFLAPNLEVLQAKSIGKDFILLKKSFTYIILPLGGFKIATPLLLPFQEHRVLCVQIIPFIWPPTAKISAIEMQFAYSHRRVNWICRV